LEMGKRASATRQTSRKATWARTSGKTRPRSFPRFTRSRVRGCCRWCRNNSRWRFRRRGFSSEFMKIDARNPRNLDLYSRSSHPPSLSPGASIPGRHHFASRVCTTHAKMLRAVVSRLRAPAALPALASSRPASTLTQILDGSVWCVSPFRCVTRGFLESRRAARSQTTRRHNRRVVRDAVVCAPYSFTLANTTETHSTPARRTRDARLTSPLPCPFPMAHPVHSPQNQPNPPLKTQAAKVAQRNPGRY